MEHNDIVKEILINNFFHWIQYFVTVGKTTVFGAQSEIANKCSNVVHIHIIGAANC